MTSMLQKSHLTNYHLVARNNHSTFLNHNDGIQF